MLKAIDFVSDYPKFHINKQQRLKSSIGGFLSMVTFLSAAFLFWFLGYDIIYKQNPKVIMKEEVTDISTRQIFDRNNTYLGLLVQNEVDSLSFEYDRIFTLTAYYYSLRLNTENTGESDFIYEEKALEMKPCSELDSQISKFSKEYEQNYLCPFDLNNIMGGVWTEDS